MDIEVFLIAPAIFVAMAVIGFSIYMTVLWVKALRKYTRSEPIRKEKTENAKSLGVVLKQHRVDCHMTQEFVAESLGVSRQAVSKWENGESDPSTTNLMALAKLYGVSAEALLNEVE